MMKKYLSSLVVGGLSLLLAGCGGGEKVLHIYTWADYVSPDVITRFEQQFKCKVVIDTFDSNETMYAKLKAGASGYDLLVPSSYMVKTMHQQGMLRKIDKAKIPNLKHIDPEHLRSCADKDMDHSVPYMTGSTGLAYLKSQLPDFEASWAMLDRVDIKGRATLLNDMRETIGAALKFLGYSINSTSEQELAEARDMVIRWKKNIAKFESEQYKTGIASGEFLLVQGYSGDIVQVMGDNADIAFATPREGTSVYSDDFVIPKDARQVELAHAYINFLHDPQVAAENIEYVAYLCPNTGAYPLLSDEIRQNTAIFMDPEIRAKSELIDDVGPALALYTKMWDEIKAAE